MDLQRNPLSELASAVGIQGINPGLECEVFDSLGNKIETVGVLGYWAARIDYFQPNLADDNLIVGLVRTTKWSKGVLILPDEFFTKRNRTPTRYLPIDLGNFEDPVAVVLRSANVFPENASTLIGDVYSYSIEFVTTEIYGKFTINTGPSKESSVNALWSALYHLIRHLADQYDDNDIRLYLKRSPVG